jgi:four helix bundle protein
MRYDFLPIYKAAYDFILYAFQLIRHFHKDFKYTLGEQIKREGIELISNIYRANIRKDRAELLERARENVEVLRLFLRLSKDLQQISVAQVALVNELLENVSRQLTGWHKSVTSPKTKRKAPGRSESA